MRRHFHLLSAFVLSFLVLVGCGGDDSEKKQPPSASLPAAELRVADQREIEIEEMGLLSLSPDGRWFIVEKRRMLCVYAAETLAQQSCAELETGPIDLQAIRWSPDSTRVVLTEEFFRTLHESDLWVLEAESGKLSNLTDDGVERLRLSGGGEEEKPLVDLVPTWSPDGKSLIFARSTQQDAGWDGTALYRISASGGDPEEVYRVSDEQPGAVWPTMRWSADGKSIFFSVFSVDSDDRSAGVWRVDRDGKNSRQLIGPDPELGPPVLADVSDQGDKLLIVYWQALGARGSEPNVSYYALLDLESGEAEPLKQAETDELEFYSPVNAIFAPDGSKVLYVYRPFTEEKPTWQVVARDLDSETENILLTAEEPIGARFELGLGLDWSEDDMIFVTKFRGDGGLLLSLGTE